MHSENSRYGTCPACGETIRSHHVLITYETDGGTSHFADCPGCRTVVHPDGGD